MFENLQFNMAGGLDLSLPRMARVRQLFDDHALPDVAAAVTAELDRPGVGDVIKPGASIAIGVGSRGVNNIQTAVRALVAGIKARGGEPFVFPAMGSHGGGTADGQRGVLAGYGVTEDEVGAPVRCTMDTVVLGTLENGTEVHMDAFAAAADGVVVINRIKPHTSYRASIESGVTKMLTIGMGKHNGATALHGNNSMADFGTVLPAAAQVILDNRPFLFGIGMVEDAYDATAIVEGLPAATLFAREEELQAKAKSLMGRIQIDEIDVLVIDEIGKEISGAGFDPNITGRNARGITGFDHPQVKKIVLLDLTDATKGNASGIGCADVITQRLLGRIDFNYTYANIVTSTYLDGAYIPIAMKTNSEAVALAVKTLTGVAPQDARIVRIKNTLKLDEIAVSEPLLAEVRAHAGMEVIGEPADMDMDAAA